MTITGPQTHDWTANRGASHAPAFASNAAGPVRLHGQCRWVAVWRATTLSIFISWPLAVCAEGLKVQTDVSAELAYITDNQNRGREFDWATVIRPGIAFAGSSGTSSVSGRLTLNAVRYARTTRENRTTYDADIKAKFDVAPPSFYVEAGVRSLQFAGTPFALSPDDVGGQDSITTTQYRLSPVLDLQLGPETTLRARSDNTKTTENGATASLTLSDAGGVFSQHRASIEHGKTLLILGLELERQTTRYSDGQTPRLSVDSARANASLPVGPDVRFGVRAGVERNDLGSEQQDDSSRIVGADVNWQPSQRTKLSAFREKRFFGSGWGLNLDHRLPMVAWSLALTRDLVTAPQLLFELGPVDNVQALLDTMLSSRFPDANERSSAVRDFMNRFNVPGSLQGVTSIYSQRLSLVTSRTVQMVMGGRSNSLALSLQHVRTEDAVDTGPFSTGLSTNNNTQRGASVSYGTRLANSMSVGAELDWRKAEGLEAFNADKITEKGIRISAGQSLGRDTQVRAVARYREAKTGTFSTFKEGSLMVGIDHRF